MRTLLLALTVATAAVSPAPTEGQTAPPARTINLIGTDDNRYSMTEIAARPGERIRVRLTTVSTMAASQMAHNFVLLRLGTPTMQVLQFVNAAVAAAATEYIPTDPALAEMIVAQTGMAGPGESVEVTFVVPEAPGDYPFVCTFPGHFLSGMRGVLRVSE